MLVTNHRNALVNVAFVVRAVQSTNVCKYKYGEVINEYCDILFYLGNVNSIKELVVTLGQER